MLQQERQRLEKNADRLMNLKGGFAIDKRNTKKEVQPVLYRNYQGFLPAKADPVHVDKAPVILSEDMQLREKKAQQEIHEKKKLVTPVFNKGGYQYPTESDLKDMKAGLLRRRS